MIIYKKESNLIPQISSFVKQKKGFIFSLLLLLLIILVSFSTGFLLEKKGIGQKIRLKIVKLLYKPQQLYYQLTTHPETLNIEIGFANLQKLEKKRQEAISMGVLLAQDEDFVPAKITYNNNKIPVKLRLKGDWPDHFKTGKWSFRIQVKKNQAVMGMTRFSIQPPETRNNLNEWLFLQAAKKEGLISLGYKFVDIFINGEPKGIYALEEHFSKELLENNQRREAPIIKYNEDVLWQEQVDFGNDNNRQLELFHKALIEPFRENKVLANPELKNQFLRAEKLLRGYRDQKLSPQKVFDYPLWAKYLALVDLFGANHALSWQNSRFYYNPISDLLEPIPFDLMPGTYPRDIALNEKLPINFPFHQIFADPDFTSLYLQELGRFLKNGYLEKLLADNQTAINQNEKNLSRQGLYKFDPEFLFANRQFMQKKLAPQNPFIAYLISSTNDQIKIEIYNADRVPFKILGLSNSKEEILLAKPVEIATDFSQNPVIPKKLSFPVTKQFNQSNLQIIYSYYHLPEKKYLSIKPWLHPDIKIDFAKDFYKYFSSLFDKNNHQYILSGNITIDQVFSIDKSAKLIIMPGTHLDIVKSGGIIIKSSLQILGNQQNPVFITSSDKTGQGILVINAQSHSKITNAQVSNLKNFDLQKWSTSGAITFYKSPVNIENLIVSNNQSEDALNIVASDFDISNAVFVNTFSDALDFDFSQGKINNLKCLQTGNDCLDFSGSKATVKDIKIDKAADKGVSVGEKSQIEIYSAEIKNSHIGFASKDNSNLKIDGITLKNLEYGLAAYQKKPEFGPSLIEAGYINSNKVNNLFLIEKKSYLWYNWKRLAGEKENIYQFLYGKNQ